MESHFRYLARNHFCIVFLYALLVIALSFSKVEASEFSKAYYLKKTPIIDGVIDAAWSQLPSHPMKYRIIGEPADAHDFSGSFKLGWREDGLYLLAEIVDDMLIDRYANPLNRYWDDDALEIFVDADASGGEHTTNYNAFAYHVLLDGQSVDIDSEGKPRLFNEHVENKWLRNKDNIVWEAKVNVFPDSFDHRVSNNRPLTLREGKALGFMLAYCDNDGSATREHFYGSTLIHRQDKNVGWKDADVFSKIILIKKK